MKKIDPKLLQIVQCSSDFFGIADPDGRTIFINRAGKEMLGIEEKFDIETTVMTDYIYLEDREKFRKEVVEKIELEKEIRTKIHFRNFQTGESVPVEMNFFIVRDDKGGIENYMAYAKDLRDYKALSENLEQTNKLLNSIIDHFPGPFYTKKCDGTYLMANEAFYSLLSIDKNTPLNLLCDEKIFPEEATKKIKENDQEVEFSKEAHYYREKIPLESGEVKFYDSYKFPVFDHQNKVIGTAGVSIDVGQQVEMEKEKDALIHQSEQIQKMAKIGGWILDVRTGETKWSREIYHIHEIAEGTPTNMIDGIGFYDEQDRPRIQKCIEQVIKNHWSYDEEFQFITAKGKKLWVRSMGAPVFDDNGEVSHVEGTFQDISSYKNTELQLRDKTEQMENVVKNSPGMVYQFGMRSDSTTFFSFIGPQAFDIYGINSEDFRSNPNLMTEMVHPEDEASLIKKISDSAHDMMPFEWKGRIISKDKQTKWILARSIPRKQKGIILWDGIVIDVSEEVHSRAALEQERRKLIQASKLATLGEMAAGIAHEINNPLAILYGNITLIDKFKDRPEKINKIQTKALRSIERIRTITKSLGRFSRESGELVRKEMSLKKILEEVIELTHSKSKRHDVPVSLTIQGDVQIICDELQIQQVLVNLVNNAIDSNSVKDPAWVEIFWKSTESGVSIIVQDAGSGISEEIQDKIFNPFYTTKEVGKGTGLGLSISSNIAKEHGGSLEYSLIEGDTAFILYLPIKEGEKNVA